jgi:hypothetical protein
MPPRLLTQTVSSYCFDSAAVDISYEDYNIHGGLTSVQQVLYNWENIMSRVESMQTGFIVLEHDLFAQSVEVATGYIIPDAMARKPALNITTVNACLNMPPGNAYIETNDNSSNPLPLSCAFLLPRFFILFP